MKKFYFTQLKTDFRSVQPNWIKFDCLPGSQGVLLESKLFSMNETLNYINITEPAKVFIHFE